MSFTLELTQHDPDKGGHSTLVLNLWSPQAIHATPPLPNAEHPEEWVARSNDRRFLLWGKWDIVSNSKRITGGGGGLGNIWQRNRVAYRWNPDTKELEFVELTDGTPSVVITARLDDAWVDSKKGTIAHRGKKDSVGKGRIFEPGKSILFNSGEITWKCTT